MVISAIPCWLILTAIAPYAILAIAQFNPTLIDRALTLGKGSLLFTAACAYAFPRYGRRRKSVARVCFSGGRNPRQIPDGRKSLSHKKEPDHGKEATLELGQVADRAGHAPQRLWGRGAGPDDGREVSDSGRRGRQVQCR